jgi:hypothetical protein
MCKSNSMPGPSTFIALALTTMAFLSLAIAASPGIPFTEQFLDTDERDATETTADWGLTTAGLLQLGSQVSLENVALAGAVMGDGLDGPHQSRGIALADFDSDGDLDAVVVNDNGEINLTYENTGGSFTAAPVDLGTAAANSRGVAVGDLDLDGSFDIVIANWQGRSVYHLNDGSGVFGAAVDISLSVDRVWAISLIDIDGDGDLDIVEGQDDSRINYLYRNSQANNSNLSFDREDIGTDTLSTRSLAFGDINGDGSLDMVSGDHASTNHLYYGDGSGGLLAGAEIQAGQSWNTFSVVLTDLNGDGALDLVEGRQRDGADLNGETLIYLNDGAGGFLAPAVLPGSNTLHTTVALLTLDFDRDGDIDIVEGNNGSWDDDADINTPAVAQPKRLFLNDGAGVFSFETELSIASDIEQTYSMAAGDIDKDGILDFAAANLAGENGVFSLSGTPSANPAVIQLQSNAESVQVDDGTNASTKFGRIIINPVDISVPALANMKFFLSNDDGANFVPAPLDRATEFPTNRVGPIRWRVEMSSSSPLPAQWPTLSEITVDINESFPIVTGPDQFFGLQGDPFTPVQIQATDADGDRLTYTLGGLPADTGLSIDGDTGIISGTVTAADAAAAPISLTAGVYDGIRWRSRPVTFYLDDGTNQAPVLESPIVDQAGSENVAYALDVSANFSDPDGDALVFTATGLPASLTMSAGGLLSGTPLITDIGVHNISVTATDPTGFFVVDSFVLTVNGMPVLDTPIADQAVDENDVVNIDISGNFSDPDGDLLTFTAGGLPASLTMSAAGTISGTVLMADIGVYNVTVTATDPGTLFATDVLVLTVNGNPVLDTPLDAESAVEGDAVNLDVSGNFSDPDGDVLTFTATGLPASLTMSAAGVATGTLIAADIGAHLVTVTATDPAGLFIAGSFTLTVTVNEDPVLDTALTAESVTVGEPANIDVSGNFSDPEGATLTFTAAGLPASLSISAAGVITGLPISAELGPYIVTVTATDPVGALVMGSFTLTVNAAPVVATPLGGQSVAEGDSLNIDIAANFSDPEADALTFSASGLPASLAISVSGVITGMPVVADIGSHVISVTATDPGGASVADTLTLTVNANQAPVLDTPLNDQTATEGDAFSIDVAGNFSDPEGNALTFSASGLPSSLTISTAGTITGTPVSADVGVHVIAVTALDPAGATAVDSFVLTVESINLPPVLDSPIVDQTVVIADSINIDTSSNFSDPNGDTLTFTANGLPGSLSMTAGGVVIGVATVGDIGIHSITVTATDPSGESVVDTFTLTVAANQTPVLNSPLADQTAKADSALSFSVAANFSDPDGSPLTFSASGLPSSLTIGAGGVTTGTPVAGEIGSHQVTVTATDPGGEFVSDIFTLVVGPANRAPEVATPIADQSFNEALAVNTDFSGNFSDPDADTLSFSAAGLPASLSISVAGVVSGTPVQGDVGTHNVTITVTDTESASVSDSFVVTILANQAPVLDSPIPEQSVDTGESATINLAGNFSDPDGGLLTFSSTGIPASMTMNTAGVISGTPAAADIGSHSVTVTATDPGGLFVSDPFSLAVTANLPPEIDTPLGDQSVNEGIVANLDVAGNFSDPEASTLSYSGTGLPGSLTLSTAGVISGTPVAVDVGGHNVTITATDPGGLTVSGTFLLTVIANQTPVLDALLGDQTVTIDMPVTIDVGGNFSDPEAGALTFSATGLPASLTINAAGVITGSPVLAEIGANSVSVTATDPLGLFVTGAFTLTIVGNQAPELDTPISDQSLPEGQPSNVDISGAFSDPDSDTLTFSATGLPLPISISAAGVLTGTPGAADIGSYNVTVTATDPGGLFAENTFSLTVIPGGGANQPPILIAQIVDQVIAQGAVASIDLASSFSDPEGDTLVFGASGLPVSITVTTVGTLTGTPVVADVGAHTVTVTATDAGGLTVSGTFTLTVTPNETPVVGTPVADQTIVVGQAVNIDFTGSVSDPDGDVLTFSATGLPASITVSVDGIASGVPVAGDIGTYLVTVTATDPDGASVSSTFTVVLNSGSTIRPPVVAGGGGGSVDLLMLLGLLAGCVSAVRVRRRSSLTSRQRVG